MPLPATVAKDPAIRALSLRPYRLSEAHYQVSGRRSTYDVRIIDGKVICNCLAAQSGNVCAHRIAVIRQYISDREKATKMKIDAPQVSGGESSTYQQPIRLARGLYGGVFRRYSQPKAYSKFNSNELEEKFFVSFLVTHDAGARPLAKPTDAFCGIRTKRFYDPVKDMASTLVRFYGALYSAKMSLEDIATCASDALPDLDDLIGFPAMLYIKPAAKADKNGIVANQIDTSAGGFTAPTDDYRRAATAIYRSMETKYSDLGLRYMASPEVMYEDGSAPAPPAHSDDVDDDELPF